MDPSWSTWASGAAPRSELLIGVGGRGLHGAYRNGSWKLIMAGGNAKRADGFSARYPGRTPVRSAPDNCGQSSPCLFNLMADPHEERNLALDQPGRLGAMVARYQELASALLSDTTLEYDAKDSTCDFAGDWCLEPDCHATFTFMLDGDSEAGHVHMNISKGCEGCASTAADGTLSEDGTTLNVVAFGKGVWIEQRGILSEGGCRVSWQQNTTAHHWADFVKKGYEPETACSAMLRDGYWEPWIGDDSVAVV